MNILGLPKYLKDNGLKVVKCWWEKCDGVNEFVVGVDDISAENRKPWHTFYTYRLFKFTWLSST